VREVSFKPNDRDAAPFDRRKLIWILMGVVSLGALLGGSLMLLREPSSPEVERLHPLLKRGHSRDLGCKITYCGDLVEISCHPEMDGGLGYYNNKYGLPLMYCGGACMGGRGAADSLRCSACPPPQWTACNASKEAQRRLPG
jgi:hypothetical protein